MGKEIDKKIQTLEGPTADITFSTASTVGFIEFLPNWPSIAQNLATREWSLLVKDTSFINIT